MAQYSFSLMFLLFIPHLEKKKLLISIDPSIISKTSRALPVMNTNVALNPCSNSIRDIPSAMVLDI